MAITPAEEAVAKALSLTHTGTAANWESWLPEARAAIIAHLEAIRVLPIEMLTKAQASLENRGVKMFQYQIDDGYTAIIDHMLAEVKS